ncbi:Putative protein of unknown function [Podospora comata]|uniref:Cyanovirin-N domain-containing protein n=1 Tax=Podospora comata TaxID=48703 RepID=A0ABY6SJ07_PODCO|nr:Putative protein of unknown function [Podospora comata]
MKFSTLSGITTVLLTEIGGALAQGGGFFQSCNHDWYMEGDRYMVATCRTKSGGWRRTRQDMNKCITNLNGNLLAWNIQGGLQYDGAPKNSRLNCMCINAAGQQDWSELELSKVFLD